MTALRVTPAQARALGATTKAKPRTRKTAGGPYRTCCVLCHTSFTTVASEDRHLAETGHPRYALVLEVLP